MFDQQREAGVNFVEGILDQMDKGNYHPEFDPNLSAEPLAEAGGKGAGDRKPPEVTVDLSSHPEEGSPESL